MSPVDGDIAAELVRGPREPLPRGRLRPEDPRIEAMTGLDRDGTVHEARFGSRLFNY